MPLEEQLEALGSAVAQGKVRHVGLSNETAWGLMRSLQLCEWPVPGRLAALSHQSALQWLLCVQHQLRSDVSMVPGSDT